MVSFWEVIGDVPHPQFLGSLRSPACKDGNQFLLPNDRVRPSYRRCSRQSVRLPLSFLLLSVCIPSFGALSGYLDMESGTNGQPVTTAILNAATHASGGSWSVNAPLTHFMVSTSFEASLLHPVTIGSSTFNDANSKRTFVYTNTAYGE